MRGLTHRWIVPHLDRPVEVDAGVTALVARVLAARGLTDPARFQGFLEPSLQELHDPSLIPDLDRAAERVLHAADANEPIALYGDYDVDGITGVAILHHMVRAIAPAADVRTYVPHRLEEGYGLNSEALVRLADDGARVVVSVDCGITAAEPAAAARGVGVDLIITDHHNPPASMDDLPPAYAVVHPRRPDSEYPFGDLCGAGVAYKLAWRLATMRCASERVTDPLRALLIELLALAALGTIADVVPLTGENRVIARHGLARVKGSAIIGVRALVRASGLAGSDVDAEHVGFQLAPRLNACGRLGHAREAVELLTVAAERRAAHIAAELSRLNDQRRAMERRMAAEAVQMAGDAGMTEPDCRAIVLAHETWHPGVIGIVAARLVERFGRPVVLLQRGADVCAGSGRSIDGYSLHGALAACAEHVETFGGHDMAAGLRVRTDRLESFSRALREHAGRHLSEGDLVPRLRVDCDASLSELEPRAVRQLQMLAPFGRGNPPVAVRVRGARIAAKPEAFGRHGAHLGVPLRQGDRRVRVVAWNWGERLEQVPAGATADAVLRPQISSWNGRVEPQLLDLHVHGSG